MNLKRLNDSLQYTSTGGWIYVSYRHEKKYQQTGIKQFSTSSGYSKRGNVYTLLKVEPVESIDINDKFSVKEVTKVIKAMEFEGANALFGDLSRKLKFVFEDFSKKLSELYPSTKNFTVSIRLLGSKSPLCEKYAKFLESNPVETVRGFAFKFSRTRGWKKGRVRAVTAYKYLITI